MPKEVNYRKLRAELEEIINTLQSDNGEDIDRTIALHERGENIIRQLQAYLEVAENKLKAVKSK